MTKRIGILTFHYADNHGAVLQAYALYKTINHMEGYSGEIINYVPKGYVYPAPAESPRLEEFIKKREKFKEFLTLHLGVHTPMLHTVAGNLYDMYLVGSDQIWNMELMEAAADCEYFLPHLDRNAKRAAYSASIGMDFEKIDRKLFRTYLSGFQDISLREKSYVGLISELAQKECEHTLDPALLLEGKEYEGLIEAPSYTGKPYLLYFYYTLGDGELGSVEMVNTLARKYDLAVLHTFSSESSIARRMLVNDGGSMIQSGIGEFLWYVKNARIVVTNSYHGAIFSILFQKPFYICYPEKRSCRQQDLVELLHLKDRVLSGYRSWEKLDLNVNYESVFPILKRERERSMDYLRKVLKTA